MVDKNLIPKASLLWQQENVLEKDLPEISKKIIDLLFTESLDSPVILWLKGEMGMGKSTLVRNIFWSMGLSRNYPVQSPTFSIMNEYEISEKFYAHMDLYRVSGEFAFDELGLFDIKHFSGIFVEWPGAVDNSSTELKPSHILEISSKNSDQRSYSLHQAQ